MMRDILFRGKDVKGNWHLGLLAHIGNAWYISNNAGVSTAFEVVPDTIGQYTGLTDQNGKQIFEGDIVHCKYANAPKNEHIQKVVFFEGKFMAEFLNGGCYAELYNGARHFKFDKSAYMTEIEVIGNIHDNPEYLKESEE